MNKGYGQALRTGFASATKEYVMYTDCDEPADLWSICDAVPHLTENDLVIGYRLNRWEGFRRFIYSIVYNALIRVLFGVHVRDVNFSFKLFRREVLHQMELKSASVFIDGEILSEATRLGLKIYEIPVEYNARQHGTSNFNSIRAVMHTLKEILAYWYRR
jgi:glycosyltransferase involved in cell wall biosynthesis